MLKGKLVRWFLKCDFLVAQINILFADLLRVKICPKPKKNSRRHYFALARVQQKLEIKPP